MPIDIEDLLDKNPTLKELKEAKGKLETQDREDAVNVLMWFLYYEVSARITAGSEVIVFQSDDDMYSFCVSNNLKLPAMKKLLEDMAKDGLINSVAMPVKLTPLGGSELCS